MLKIDPEGTLKETNELRIKTVKTPDDSIETVLSKYSDVFQGIDCCREKNTGRKIDVKLEMETDPKPVAQKPRPLGEAITWCSSLVVQPKPKFTEMKRRHTPGRTTPHRT